MMVFTWLPLAAFAASTVAAVMAGLLSLTPQSKLAHRSLGALLAATALAQFANGAGLVDDAHALNWRMLSMIAELLQPAALLYVGLAFLDPVERTQDAATRWRARTIGGLGLVLSALIVSGRVFEWQAFPGGHTAIVMSSMGHVALIFIV